MCFTKDDKQTEKLRAKLRAAGRKGLMVYKCVEVLDGHRCGPHYPSIDYVKGTTVVAKGKVQKRTMRAGIYVFPSLATAKHHRSCSEEIIRLRVYTRDLIAAGRAHLYWKRDKDNNFSARMAFGPAAFLKAKVVS